MIKRTTAYILVFLATFILLAHAVVPHCHHSNEIEIFATCTDTENHDHDHENHQHDHHDADDCEFCLLKQLYTTPVYYTRHYIISNTSSDSNEFVSIFTENFFCFDDPLIFFTSHTYHDNILYTFSAYHVSGLRGPPAV